MGLISRIFGGSSDLEKELENLYVQMLQTMKGISFSEAEDMARTMLEQAKQDSEKEGTAHLPTNFGDILLEEESTDERIKSMLAKLRTEGVRDEDIRWWWNMHDLERRMMQQVDLLDRYSLFLKLKEEDGLNEGEAAKRVGKSFPIFGDPEDTTLTAGQDRPLPYELKDRINIYVEKRGQSGKKRFKKEIEESSSFNSLIRKKIKKGHL